VNTPPHANGLRALNLAAAFLLELGLLAACGYWGFTLPATLPWRILAGAGAPLAVIGIWARLAAPRSTRRLPQPWLTVLKLMLFALASLALWRAGRPGWGALLLAAAVINLALGFLWKQ